MSLYVESSGAGPPLVLLHGWAMHSGLWLPVLPTLESRFRVHRVDLPGHGFSAAISPYTLAGMVDAVSGTLALAPLPEAATIVGWSLGGAVALEWARARADEIARLVLIGTTPSFVARDGWPHAMSRETLARFGDELDLSYRATLQRFVILQVRGSEHEREVLAQLRSQLFARGEPTREALAATLALLAATDLREDIGDVEQPALVVSGGRDALAPPAAGAWLAAALPQGRHALIDGAAHAPFLSHAEAFLAALTAFCDGR